MIESRRNYGYPSQRISSGATPSRPHAISNDSINILVGKEVIPHILSHYHPRENEDFHIFTDAEKRSLERGRAGVLAGYYYDPSQDGFFTEPLPQSIEITNLSLQLRANAITLHERKLKNSHIPKTVYPSKQNE